MEEFLIVQANDETCVGGKVYLQTTSITALQRQLKICDETCENVCVFSRKISNWKKIEKQDLNVLLSKN